MKQFNITGMSCAACSARVEKAVMAVEGVSSCAVSLLTTSMGVSGSASADEIIAAVEKAGYGASEKGKKGNKKNETAALGDRETSKLVKRLVISLVLNKSHKRFNKQSGLNVQFVLLKSFYEVLLKEMV